MAKKRKVSDTVVADFGHKDAKSGGGSPRLPEGDYIGEILEAEKSESKAGNTMITWKIRITEGKYSGKKITTRTVLTPQALWNLRQLLEALGVEVPEKSVNVKFKKYVGQEIGFTLEDGEPYGDKNRVSSEVTEWIDPDVVRSGGEDEEEEDEDDEDEEDTEEDEDEDDDEEDEDEEDDEDEVDLEDL